MARTASLSILADKDRTTIEEVAGLLPSRWPVDALVLYGSKARGDDTPTARKR